MVSFIRRRWVTLPGLSNYSELQKYFQNPDNLKGAGQLVTELGDKFMLIKWDRFKD